MLNSHRIDVDSETRIALLRQVAEAALDGGWRNKRATGDRPDFSPDPAALRFPPIPKAGVNGKALTITGLFDRWAKETKPAASTLSTWRGIMEDLRTHLKHEDATRVTEADAVAWKGSLVTKGLAAKTIRDGHLAAARRVFGYGAEQRKLKANPFKGVAIHDNLRTLRFRLRDNSNRPYGSGP